MILRDIEIAALKPLDPFINRKVVHECGASFGLSCCGYDIRSRDPVNLAPGEFMCVTAIEQFRMPPNLVAFPHDKSTWARMGLAVQNTVIEPGWHGELVLELTNHGRNHFILPAGAPIAQIIFHQLMGNVARPYDGKYQGQKAGQGPILETIGTA